MWSKKRLSLTESTRIRPKPSNPDAFRTTPARSPSKTARLRRISDHPRAEPTENSETQTRFGPPPPRFAVEPAGAGAPKAQRAGVRPHWGRLRCIGVGKLPTPMGGFLPQCVSVESGGGAGPVLAAIPRGLRAPGSGSRAPWAVLTAIPTRRGTLSQRYLRFHSATTLCKRYNALGLSQEVQRAVCVGFLRGFPAEAFAGSLVELIVHLLDPRGADAVQWGPLGEVVAQQAVGVLA